MCFCLLSLACTLAFLSRFPFLAIQVVSSKLRKALVRISVPSGRQATLGGGSLREEGVAIESGTAVSR